MNNPNDEPQNSNIPPASERAIKAIAPILTVASFIGMANTTDNQLAHSFLFAGVLYLFTTSWAVFDNFDANGP